MCAQPAIRLITHWSWSDYQTWPHDKRWELIAGEAFAMAPAPSIAHQSVTLRLAARLEQALKGKSCRPFVAPVDVRLSDTDVVQPDVLVVCDSHKITTHYIDGAPDLVIEVLSPATATRDLREKKALYAQYGVREYLVVDPLENYVTHFLLDEGHEGRYGAGDVFGGDEVLPLVCLPTVEIALWEVFDLPAPGTLPAATSPM